MKSQLTVAMSLGPNAHISQGAELAARFERDVIPLRAELLRAAKRMTNRGPDAEDLVQDTFLRAWRSFATFDPGTNVKAWMYQILKNTWINKYRATQSRVTEVMVEDFTDQLAGRAQSSTAPADVLLLAAQLDQKVQSAMAALTDEFRTVVYLADIEGYPYADIAEMMGTPVGTVMSRLHRARRQLRVALSGGDRQQHLVAAA